MPERLSERGVSIGENVGRAVKFLSSGDTALRFGARAAKKVSGGRIDITEEDIQNAPAPVRFLSDTFLSPIGLASTVLAPVTGGTSLGMKGAAGAAARLSTRLLPEAAVSAAATGASKLAEAALPEDTNPWVKLGVTAGAGLLAGGAVGGGIRAAVTPSAGAVRGTLVEEARKKGYRYIVGQRDHASLVDEVGRDMDSGVMARTGARLREELGVDPSATAQGAMRDIVALNRNYSINDNLVKTAMSVALPKGANAFVLDEKGFLRNIRTPEPLHFNTFMEDVQAKSKYTLTKDQEEQAQALLDLVDDTIKLGAEHGIVRPKVDTPGGRYFPRGVKGKNGSAYVEGIDSVEQRMWENMEDAALAGIEVGTPEEQVRQFMKAMYDEVAERQFERAVLAKGATMPKAAKETANGRISWLENVDANKKLKAAEQALTKAKAEGAMGDEVAQLETAVAELTTKALKARSEWGKVSSKSVSKLPGSVVGRNDDEVIDVKLWRGIDGRKTPVYVAAEDATKLNQWLDERRAGGPRLPAIVKGVEELGNAMRFAAATGDFSAPMVQGLPLLAHSPVAWGKMAASNLRAFFQPEVQTNYIKNNIETVTEMAMQGRVPIGEIELFKAMEKGGWAEKALRQPIVNKTAAPAAKRFQQSYDTTLTIVRAELWKAMKSHFDGTPEELGRLVRNMTGGLESRGLGVGPNQRALESMFLFAPKMLRSTLALTGQAMRPWTPDGAEAAHTMLRLMAAGAGVMGLANIAAGIAAGESDEQIEKRLDETMNPLKGRQFLSFRVGDNWYGLGGQFRSATQLVARSVANPESLWDADTVSENPLLRYAQGRLSPIANVGLGVTELMTDEDLNVLPYETIDDFPDVVRLAGTSALPFFMQSVIENSDGFSPFDTDTYKNFGALRVGPWSEMLGSRSSVSTPTDLLDSAAWQRYGMGWSDLTGREQEVIKADNPDAVRRMDEFGDKQERQLRAATVKTDQTARDLLVALNDALRTNRIKADEFREGVSDVMHDRYLRNEQARQLLGKDTDPADSPKRMVLDAYFKTFQEAGFTPDGGMVDWNKWEELQTDLDRRIAAEEFGPSARARQYLDERRKFQLPPELKWFEDNKKIIEDAGFWAQKDLAFERFRPMAAQLGYDVASVHDLEALEDKFATQGDMRALQVRRLLNRIQTDADERHMRMRKRDKRLEQALWQNGFIQKPKQAIAQQA